HARAAMVVRASLALWPGVMSTRAQSARQRHRRRRATTFDAISIRQTAVATLRAARRYFPTARRAERAACHVHPRRIRTERRPSDHRRAIMREQELERGDALRHPGDDAA